MKNYPFINVSLVFICGILTNYFFELSPQLLLILLTIYFLIFITIKFLSQTKKIELISIISLFLFVFTLGNYLYAVKIENKTFLPEELKIVEKIIVIGSIHSIDLKKEEEITFQIKSDSVRVGNIYKKIETLFLCKVRDNKQNLEKLYSRLLPGNKVRVEGTYMKGREIRNPGEFDYNKYLRSNGISGLLYVNDQYEIKIIDWEYNLFKSSVFIARKFIDSKISAYHNAQSASLLRGLLLADRSGIDIQTKTEFVNSGVMHILAVSGLHVGYIVLIFFVAFGRLNIFLRSILTSIGLIIFLLLTGMPASVFRAVTMALVIIFAYMTNRSSNIFNSLAIAALIVLIFNPEELFSSGFQLSFIAVLSIAVIYPLIKKIIYSLKFKSKLINYLLLFMGVSLSAQIGTLPLTLVYFGKLSLVSLITNLLVISLAGIIVGIGIFTLLVSFLIPSFAVYYANANELIIFVMFKIISFTGTSDFSFIYVKDYTFFDSFIFYITTVLIILSIYKIRNYTGKFVFVLLIILNSIVLSSLDNKNLFENKKLNVMMTDVSRGDAILIKFPNEKTALIDAGYASFSFDTGEMIIKPLLNHLGIDTIDFGFISCMSQESYGGFISLIKNANIRTIFKPAMDSTSFIDLKFEEMIRLNKIKIRYFEKSILKIGDVRIYFLNDNASNSNYQNSLNKTGVIKVVYGGTSFLFPGNIEYKAESFYIDKYGDFLKSAVLIISNSGSAVSSSLEFLKKVQPEISLISIENRNKFNHPSEYVLDRLKKINSKIYRTDEEGAIILQSDGTSLTKVNWK